MAGVVVCNDQSLAERLYFVQNAEGTGLSPFDCWLIIRGMRTLAIRMEAAQTNALRMYEFLCQHPHVIGVNYLRDPFDRRVDLIPEIEDAKRSFGNSDWKQETAKHYSQATGGGAVLSFETTSADISRAVVANCRLFKNTVSFGSYCSLIEIPSAMSHASIPKHMQTMSPALIRVSLGIENSIDLIEDLSRALTAATKHATFTRELPISCSLPLGESLPPRDDHAVGVSMPTWDDVVGYELGDVKVHSKLSGGYPRFVFLHAVKQLFAKAEVLFAREGETAMVFPSARVALRFQKFMDLPSIECHDLAAHGAFAVTFPKAEFPKAKKFWQHTGEIPSSRLAASILEVVEKTCYENRVQKLLPSVTPEPAHEQEELSESSSSKYKRAALFSPLEALKKRISQLTQQDPHNIYLYPTGMAAVTATQRLLKLTTQWDEKPLRTVVFGFPYLDTLKLAQLTPIGSGCAFFGHGSESDFQELRKLLKTESISGLFLEFPSNPLLKAPDLRRLRGLADEFNFPLIVDDSISGFCNVDLAVKGGADIIVTSLTKQFSGDGNVMGGSLILNEHGSFYDRLKNRISRDHEELLFVEDAQKLLQGSIDLEERVNKTNKNAMAIVSLLQHSPLVQTVYHPSVVNRELYDDFKRDLSFSGHGGLLSVVFKDESLSKPFFDGLDVAKGPGFGTNFSLACPYTMLAHFYELEWAKQYGVAHSLVRIWIGQESERELQLKFNLALDTAGKSL